MSRNSQKFKQPNNNQTNKEHQPTQEKDPREAPSPGNLFGLSFVVPTEEVFLPTQGLHYPVSSPFYQVESVEIKHMTAKEEDILSNQDPSDDAFKMYDKLIDSLVVDKKYKAADLLEEDKLAFILSARSTGYGAEYETESYCESCKKLTKHTFDLSKTSFKEPVFKSEYNPEENSYSSVLPKTKIKVKLFPLTDKIKDEIAVEKKQKDKYNLPYNKTISSIFGFPTFK